MLGRSNCIRARIIIPTEYYAPPGPLTKLRGGRQGNSLVASKHPFEECLQDLFNAQCSRITDDGTKILQHQFGLSQAASQPPHTQGSQC